MRMSPLLFFVAFAAALAFAACGDDATNGNGDASGTTGTTPPPAATNPAPALEGTGWIGDAVDVTGPGAVRAVAFFKPG
jgi:hypothetical protein